MERQFTPAELTMDLEGFNRRVIEPAMSALAEQMRSEAVMYDDDQDESLWERAVWWAEVNLWWPVRGLFRRLFLGRHKSNGGSMLTPDDIAAEALKILDAEIAAHRRREA